MRLTTVLLIATMMQVSAFSFAQKINMSTSRAPLKQVLRELRTQSGYDFVYEDLLLKKSNPVDIKVKEGTIESVLEMIFKDQPLSYQIENRTVVIKEKEPSLLDKTKSALDHVIQNVLVIQSAAKDLRGRVLDQDGKPLPNASIRIKGKNTVTNTNQNGEFEIKDVADDAVILVSYVGFKTLEIELKDAVMPLEIKLNVATGELEEVKVVYDDGYQKLNKERSTGSFVHIDNELLNRTVGTNVLERITNVTNGLISNPGGLSIGSTGIIIRGFSTINADKSPLIVVDNFPYEGDLNNLNPNDVESITVLKDAAAASIWGVRAGNGVIVITTKKGQFNQATNVSFNSNVTIGQKPDLFYIPYISSKDMIQFERQRFSTGMYNAYDDQFPSIGNFTLLPQSIEILLAARKKNKGVAGYSALNDPAVSAQLDELGKYDVRDDINNYLLKNSLDLQYALNLSGGAGTFNYYASLGYDKNKGQNLHQESDRISLNFNNTWKPIKNMEISSSIVHTRTMDVNSGADYSRSLPSLANGVSPYTRLADENGSALVVPNGLRSAYVDTASYPGLLDWHYKPLEDYLYRDNRIKQNDTRISAITKYSIRPWLKAEFQFQNQISLSNRKDQQSLDSYFVRDRINKGMTVDASGKKVYPWPLGDYVKLQNSELKSWNVRGSLRFEKQFKDHGVSAFGGIELRETNVETNNNTLYGFDPDTYLSAPVNPTQSLPARPRGSIATPLGDEVTGKLIRNGSFFANAAYNFKGKYLATLSGRMDQSNFFGVKANLRRVPLWSTGLAWNLNMEDFYDLEWLPLLKLKTSYGYTGNTNSGASSYATFIYSTESGDVPLRNVIEGELRTPNNPELRWERVKIVNAGLDFNLRNNRFSGSLQVYYKNGLDLLGDVNLDPTTGVYSFTGNQAGMKSRGFDLAFNTINIIGKSFDWSSNLNISFNEDKVTAYKGFLGNLNGKVNGTSVYIGDPLYAIYSYRFAGLNPANGDPRLYLSDTISVFTNYTKAKDEDLVFHGQRNPKIFGNFMNTLRWRQISLSANIIYRLKYYFRRNSIEYTSAFLNIAWSSHADYDLRWVKPGDELITNVPALPTTANSNRNTVYSRSDILVEKGDHFRLQDIRLNYMLTRNAWKRLPLKQVSIYAYATNLGIIWRANKLGLDPDAYRFGSMPKPKTIAFGLNANF